MARARGAMRHPHRDHARGRFWPRPSWNRWRAWYSWKTFWAAGSGQQAARIAAARLRGGAVRASARLPARARRIRWHGDLFERQHRHSEGRDALALQPDRRISRPSRSCSGSGERDRIVGVLPFFHSFGFTVTIWFPLIAGCGVVLPSESDGRQGHRRIDREAITPRSCFPRRPSAPITRASARAKNSPPCASCWWARRSCASRWPRRSARSSAWSCWRDTAARRWRRWWR